MEIVIVSSSEAIATKGDAEKENNFQWPSKEKQPLQIELTKSSNKQRKKERKKEANNVMRVNLARVQTNKGSCQDRVGGRVNMK